MGVALVFVLVGALLAALANVAALAAERQAQVAKALHLHHPLLAGSNHQRVVRGYRDEDNQFIPKFS